MPHGLETKHRIVDYDISNGGTALYKAIEQRHWKNAFGIIHHAPHEVSTYVQKNGQFLTLPLHEACRRKPPSLLVSSLLAAYPDAASIKCDSYLPLHIAVKHGASLDVIQMLIVADPDSITEPDPEGNTPKDIFNTSFEVWDDLATRTNIENVLMKGIRGIHLDQSSNSLSLLDTSFQSIEEPSAITNANKELNDLKTTLNDEGWMKAGLIITVIGASGDLAKKKTYPSLLHLYDDNLLPDDTLIWGFARTDINHEELRSRLKPYLQKSGNYSNEVIDQFLSKCFYQQGSSYGDMEAFQRLATEMENYEDQFPSKLAHNRLFYFAIPPNVFAETGVAIKSNAMATKGWSRMIIEKPFGKDLQSCEELLNILAKNFDEEQIYRIDHYLGKEMVQNLLVLRFSNIWFERMWNKDNIQCVILTFKEPFGTEGRGGYFDQYGIIRDIIQNHLLQVASILAMEAPVKADGPDSGEAIRDAKVHVLKSIAPVTIDDCFLGQYEGYTDDPTIKNKQSTCPTFAVIRCFVNTPRWAGVPFIFKAGKALNERKAEMRIQFKDSPAADFLFDDKCPRNELVMRMQPDEAIYIKTNVKSPGFSFGPIQSELEVNYNTRFFRDKSHDDNPDAYTRLILEVLRGRSGAFVREDELRRSWGIFTPLLHKIERESIKPIVYQRGTRGPPEADEFIFRKSGYVRNEDYVFYEGDVVRGRKSNL